MRTPILLIGALALGACTSPQPPPARSGTDAVQPEAAAPAPAPVVPPRQTMVSVMSWHTPLGDLNGATVWQADAYLNKRNLTTKTSQNWRWPDQQGMPATLAVGSPAYLDQQERCARADLELMAEAGFDVALFDMLPWPDWKPDQPLTATNTPLAQFTTFQRWLKAATGLPVSVGLYPDGQNRSGDYPKGHIMTADEWVASLTGALRLVQDAPTLWRVDGRPAVFHFATSYLSKVSPDPKAAPPDCGWREVLRRVRAAGQDLYFLADVRPHEPERAAWDGIADAFHCFHPGGPTAYLAEMQPILQRRHRIPYVWSTSIGYYSPYLKSWTPPEFRRIHDTYTLALAQGARFVHAMTWNDFGEDTDIAPTRFKGRCLLDVHAYYNRWFKDGREPAAWREHLIVGYPRAIPAEVTARSVNWGTPEGQRKVHQPDPVDLEGRPQWGDWRQPPYHPTLIWWARLDKPRTLDIPGVGRKELPAGLSMGELGAIAAGPVSADCGQGQAALPAVLAAAEEKTWGLQYRYHDLLRPDGRESQP